MCTKHFMLLFENQIGPVLVVSLAQYACVTCYLLCIVAVLAA